MAKEPAQGGGEPREGANHTKADKKTVSHLTDLLVIKEQGEQKKKKEEQERTRIAKKIVLEQLVITKGVIFMACEKAQVSRAQFYIWRRDDPDFAAAVRSVHATERDEMEDVLRGLALIEKDGPSVRFYLERRHADYKKKLAVEGSLIAPQKPLEDILREAAMRKAAKNNHDNNGTGDTGGNADKPGAGGGATQDPQQAGGTGAVLTEPGTGPVHAEKDAPKPDTQSEAGGAE